MRNTKHSRGRLLERARERGGERERECVCVRVSARENKRTKEKVENLGSFWRCWSLLSINSGRPTNRPPTVFPKVV